MSGEQLSLRLRIETTRDVPPPRLGYELRDEGGRLVAAGNVEMSEIGWPASEVRFDVESLPLADGRFQLAHRFHHIQIEGEQGFGKPEERAYLHAMDALGVTAADTWMIGDNLEWEVEVPQKLGIYAIWMDVHGDGLPPGSTVKPDRIIRSLGELLPVEAT